jgi:hypothetical protein
MLIDKLVKTGEVYSLAMAATVAGGTERLLLMRQGLYTKSISATDLSKLEVPTPGFLGDVSKSKGYDTIQKPGLIAVSIQYSLIKQITLSNILISLSDV